MANLNSSQSPGPNILVTGGAGFIGTNLVNKLVDYKYNVYVIDDFSTGLEDNICSGAIYIRHDIVDYISNPDLLKNVLVSNKIDIIIHLAAMTDVRESIEKPINAFNVNLLSTISICDVALENGISKLLFASTSAVFGEPEYLPVDEFHPQKPISPYGLSKLSAESFLINRFVESSIDFVSFRLPNVYGPRQRSDLEGGVVAIFNDKMINNDEIVFFGDGKQTRDWVHVDDIANAFILGVNKNNIGQQIICLGTKWNNSLEDLFNYLSNYHNYTKIPKRFGAKIGDIKHMSMSFKRAKEILNWEPKINLEKGINLL